MSLSWSSMGVSLECVERASAQPSSLRYFLLPGGSFAAPNLVVAWDVWPPEHLCH